MSASRLSVAVLSVLLVSWSFSTCLAYDITAVNSPALFLNRPTTFSVTLEDSNHVLSIESGTNVVITCEGLSAKLPVIGSFHQLTSCKGVDSDEVRFDVKVTSWRTSTISAKLKADDDTVATAQWDILPWFMTSNAHKAVKVFYPVPHNSPNIFAPVIARRLGEPIDVTSDSERFLQDYVEFGYQVAGDGEVHATAINFKNQGVTTQMYTAADATSLTLVQALGGVNTFNMGGNLEVTPPYPGQPYGRIVYGETEDKSGRLPMAVQFFLKDQKLQTPLIPVKVDGLKVGHVDEVLSFVPLISPCRQNRAFKVLFPSISDGLKTIWKNRQKPFLNPPRTLSKKDLMQFKFLFFAIGVKECQALEDDGEGSEEMPACNPLEITGNQIINTVLKRLPNFQSGHHIVLNHGAHRVPYQYRIEEWVTLDKTFKEAEKTLKAALGDVMEAIHIPILMNKDKAMFPNMVNHLVFVDERDHVQHIVPHSYITGFNQQFQNRVRKGDRPFKSRRYVKFVDDYKDYHEGAGDTHCATNALRSHDTHLKYYTDE